MTVKRQRKKKRMRLLNGNANFLFTVKLQIFMLVRVRKLMRFMVVSWRICRNAVKQI
jgi:hypothetical protein